jgi:hypothetical protein
MGIADDIRDFTKKISGKINDKEYDFRIKQLEDMIKTESKRGKFHLKVSRYFFEDETGKRVADFLMEEGFQVIPFQALSSFVSGGPDKGDWTISWKLAKDEEGCVI